MKLVQLILIIAVVWRGQYVLGTSFRSYGYLSRRLMLEGDPQEPAANINYVYWLSDKCSATQITADKIVTTRGDCESKQYCTKAGAGAAGGGGEGGGEEQTTTEEQSAAPLAAAGADEAAPEAGATNATAGGGAAGDCKDLKDGTKASSMEVWFHDVAGTPPTLGTLESAGPCSIAAMGAAGVVTAKAECTPGDTISIKSSGPKICPVDSGAAVLNDKMELIGVITKVDACGDSATAFKSQTISSAAGGGAGDAGGDAGGDATTPGEASTVRASMFIIGIAGIITALFTQ